MFKKITIGVGISLTILITVTLYNFGFFSTVTIKEITSPQKIVLGKYFEGNPKSEAFRDIFQEVGKMTESGLIDGKVCGIYLNNPENNEGKIKAIIGIFVADSSFTKPKGYSYSIIPEREVIQAYLNADFRVATFKNYTAIFEYSKENKIALTDQFFEWFESKEDVYIEALKK